MLVLLFVALWFILRGDLFYVTSCYFVLVFFSPFSIAITSLWKERANLSFRTFFRFALVCFCLFPLPLGVWEGLRFVIVALPGLFSYLFFGGVGGGVVSLLLHFLVSHYLYHICVDKFSAPVAQMGLCSEVTFNPFNPADQHRCQCKQCRS